MSKRFQPTKDFGHCLKKPKYDININKERPSLLATKARTNNNHVAPLKTSISSYWDDDDDDDVILLATQVAEAAAVAKDKVEVITDSELTFSEFAKVSGTSTQNAQNPSNDLLLSQMFDDDDDLELLAAVEKQDPCVFKKPAVPPTRAQQTIVYQPNSTKPSEDAQCSQGPTQHSSEFVLSQSSGPACTLPSTQSAARRQLASERQIKFLMEKMELLKKENSNLSKSLSESKSKIESKEGETKLLRDELKHLKQQVQNLKMEKIFSTEAAKTESQNKIKELTKKVEGKEAELKLKEVQCSKMKMRLADESHKLQQSICQESIRQVQIKKRTVSTDSVAEQQMTVEQRRYAKSLLKMPTLDLNCLNASEFNDISVPYVATHPDIYLQQQGTLKKKRTLFELELERMQTLLAELRLLGGNNLPNDFKAKCIDSLRNISEEFTSYIDTLSFQENSNVYPYHGYSLLKTKITRKLNNCRQALQQPNELYADEMAISLRRYFAGLSIICQEVPAIANAIVYAELNSTNTCLLVIFNCIDHLGYSTEICEHFGLLEAIAMWTSTLLKNATHVDDLLHLIKYIIFARPSAWVFKEVSFCLYQFCYENSKLIRCLCRVNEEDSFTSDRVGSIYRFCDESCILQVYCGLLEIAFPLNNHLSLEYFKLLAVICFNHVRFANYLFNKPPWYIHYNFPVCEEEEVEENAEQPMEVVDAEQLDNDAQETDEQIIKKIFKNPEQNSSSSANIRKCECYVKLCLSVVTLVFQLMRQWVLHKEHSTSQVAEISRIAVHLLHTIFCDNYITSLFRESEETTKHYLVLICKWWSENLKTLEFNDINIKFLYKLQNFHILPKDISAETNPANITNDLMEWQKTTNDKVEHHITISASNTMQGQRQQQIDLKCVENLRIIEQASNQEKFFEGLKGFAFNFQ